MTTNEAQLPKSQAKALNLLRQLGGSNVCEFHWQTAGAGTSAMTYLERKGFVVARLAEFVMPVGPYAGQAMTLKRYTLTA